MYNVIGLFVRFLIIALFHNPNLILRRMGCLEGTSFSGNWDGIRQEGYYDADPNQRTISGQCVVTFTTKR